MQYSLFEGASIETVNGQSMMLTEQGDVAILNETGQYIVSKLIENNSLEEVVSLLAKDYGIDMESASMDVKHLIKELEEKCFLRACE